MKEPMHQFKYTKLTSEQIAKKLIPSAAGLKCAFAYADVLAGISLKIVTDNCPMLNYRFNRAGTLALVGGC